jgi:hypothetical protein
MPRRDNHGESNELVIGFNFPLRFIEKSNDDVPTKDEWRVGGGRDPRDHTHLEGDLMFQFQAPVDLDNDGSLCEDEALSSFAGKIFQKTDTTDTINETICVLGFKVKNSIDGKDSHSNRESSVLAFGAHSVVDSHIEVPLQFGTQLFGTMVSIENGGITDAGKDRLAKLNQFPTGLKPDMEGSGKKRLDLTPLKPYDMGVAPLLLEHKRWLEHGDGKNIILNEKSDKYKKIHRIIALATRDNEITPQRYKEKCNAEAGLKDRIEKYIKDDAEYYFKEILSLMRRYATTCTQSAGPNDSFTAFRAKV